MKPKIIAFALCLLASSAEAKDEAEHFDVRPTWLKRPSGEDVLAVWPSPAWAKGLGGRAVISCRVTLQGALANCSVLSEDPAGAGFGLAAIALSPQFLLKPGIRDGKPVESTATIPIVFQPPGIATGTHIPGAGTLGYSTTLTNVNWIAAPTYDEVVAAYPEKARLKGLGGRATLDCEFRPGGGLGDCNMIQEEPKGQGFATAAKVLAQRFVGPETLPNGASTKGVSTQITFVFDSDMLDPAKRVVGKASWAKLPSGGDVAAGYPVAAAKAGVRSARVVMLCEIGEQGRLAGCSADSEEPGGHGFAASAIAMSPLFQVKPWSDEGLPMIGGKIRVPIRFQLPEPAAASK